MFYYLPNINSCYTKIDKVENYLNSILNIITKSSSTLYEDNGGFINKIDLH